MTRTAATLLILATLVAGCGDGGAAARDVPTDARDLLACATGVHDRGHGNYDTGPEQVARTSADALAGWIEEGGTSPWTSGMRVTEDAGSRAVGTATEAGRVVAAAVLSDDVSGQGQDGWGVTSWAYCDPADFPAEVSDASWMQVWEDADGRRVGVDEVVSYAGPEHCDWQHLTFLTVRRAEFVGGPAGYLGRWLDGRWEESTTLPDDAIGTGYHRDGRRLWLAADGSAAYVGAEPSDVERWPRDVEGIGCA